ncbi:head-tail connector protein [Brevibacillus choshinensis]|uniref:head-tail connector protein n=1 Tax=Brevibacillus choshinensis TaxID=54911 RepID=UPI002E1CC3A6|nr:head-tail connector protein [Brevibacillus choshinensis]MED4586667.1 head-tail connector protein [Brevibacillus choshinensis]
MNLTDVKAFLRIDGDYEDNVIQSLILAAETFLKNGGVQPDATNELYNLTGKLLVAHWYENREVLSSATNVQNEIPFGLRSMILQLKYQAGGTA